MQICLLPQLRGGDEGGAGMTVYELIQELAYFKADTPVFVKIRNTSTEFEVDSVDYEFHVVNAMVNGVTNRVKITIDG